METMLLGDAYMKFFDRLFFPLLIFLSPAQSKRLGLTPIDDERKNICLKHAYGKVLDIGCGHNRFVQEYGNDSIGVDVYRFKGSEKVTIVKDSSDLPFRDKAFDTISFIASLNHIPNRKEVLEEAKRVLKDNGRILITMINPVIGWICHKLRYPFDPDQKERGMKDGELWGMWKWMVKALLTITGFKLVESQIFVWGLNRLYIGKKNDKT